MTVVGIDLGTTYSVIATPDKFDGKPFEIVRDATIIKDEHNQRLTPSVVAVDREGRLLVGRRAKARAGQQPEPIMFVKRHMGEDLEILLGARRMRPEQVSAEILRYLKETAERQMGEAITEAVISVPAYFTMIQKQKTREAADLAGLRLSQIVQEPVAAALMYCYDDARDPLRIVTYDLGGGTFDVAVLKRERGVFEILAFDGDRFLGGYDFDLRLAEWLIARLTEQGFHLDFGPDSTADRALMSKMLVFAEMAKLGLTERDTYTLLEANTGLADARGEPITLDVEIPRDAFESLIADDIDRTVHLTRQALEKAKLRADQIDEIVLVGGSSRLALVRRRLEQEFGRRPKLVEPDLGVAIGAAQLARQLGRRVGVLKLGAVPEVTSLGSIQVAGSLEPTPEVPDVGGLTVVLSSVGGTSQRKAVASGKGFVFPQVPLKPRATTTFELRVEDAAGGVVVTHSFRVRHEPGAAHSRSLGGLETNVLAKPIAIGTVEGLKVVARELTALPSLCEVPAETMDNTGAVRVPVYEDTHPIGEILVTDIPPDLPVGTPVEITLALRADFTIEGKAFIPAVSLAGATVIKLKPVVVPGLPELQARLTDLERQANEALAQADPGQAFRIRSKLRAALGACRKVLFEESQPTLGKAHELLSEIEALLRQLGSEWRPDPSPQAFEKAQREITEVLLPELLARKPSAKDDGYEGRLKTIAQQGKRALGERDGPAWSRANQRLRELRDEIEAAAQQTVETRGGRAAPPPDPSALKLQLGIALTQLRETARERDRMAALQSEFDACERTLRAIDAKAPEAMAHLLDYRFNAYEPLRIKVTAAAPPPTDGPGPDGLTRVVKGSSPR
jgi:actin-like ATPase involved in cell morphogenesis